LWSGYDKPVKQLSNVICTQWQALISLHFFLVDDDKHDNDDKRLLPFTATCVELKEDSVVFS